jgi:glycosyltransferase involved in cell wall biosynthesis
MAKVSIYTTQYNNLHLLKQQYEKLKKHCLDDIEYVVVNNGIDQETYLKINDFCLENCLQQILIPKNDRIKMTAMHHKEALQYTYDNFISKDTSDFRVVMDSDIIPFNNFSFLNLIGDSDIAGIQQGMIPSLYLASFISIYSKKVEFIDFDLGAHIEFDPYLCTVNLVKKYKTKWINHTAPMKKIEGDYVFKNSSVECLPYQEDLHIQFIEGCLLHYYRGSAWDNGDPNYYKRKVEYINSFLENTNLYNPCLDKNVQ